MGDIIHTVGFPLGEKYSVKPRMASGHVNSEYGVEDAKETFQLDIAIQPGNSGGVIFNDDLDIIGIISSSIDQRTFYGITGNIAQNMNYGIKAKYLKRLMKNNGIEFDFNQSKSLDSDLKHIVKDVIPFVCLIKSYA